MFSSFYLMHINILHVPSGISLPCSVLIVTTLNRWFIQELLPQDCTSFSPLVKAVLWFFVTFFPQNYWSNIYSFIFLADVHQSDFFKFSAFRVLSCYHLWTPKKVSGWPHKYLVQRLTWLDFCITYVQRDMAYVYMAFSFPNAFLTGYIHSCNTNRNEWKKPHI